MTYLPQVGESHYHGGAYRYQDRWNSYWHQLSLVRKASPQTLLEVGAGEGVVARQLRQDGVGVTTVDIAADLHPDAVGSVTALPFAAGEFEAALAAEVLEHIRFEDVSTALRELARVARSHVIISLPHPGYVFSFVLKVPLLPRMEVLLQVPFFWKTHQFNGEHYWELGKRGYPVRRFVALARDAGLRLVEYRSFADDPAHRFFVFEKK